MWEVGGDVEARRGDQQLQGGERAPQDQAEAVLGSRRQPRRTHRLFHGAVRQHVPDAGHGHRVTGRRAGTRLARGRELHQVRQGRRQRAVVGGRWRGEQQAVVVAGVDLVVHLQHPPVGPVAAHQPFEDHVEPLGHDQRAEQASAQRPLQSEHERKVDGEHVLGVEHFGHVHEKVFAVWEPVESNVG